MNYLLCLQAKSSRCLRSALTVSSLLQRAMYSVANFVYQYPLQTQCTTPESYQKVYNLPTAFIPVQQHILQHYNTIPYQYSSVSTFQLSPTSLLTGNSLITPTRRFYSSKSGGEEDTKATAAKGFAQRFSDAKEVDQITDTDPMANSNITENILNNFQEEKEGNEMRSILALEMKRARYSTPSTERSTSPGESGESPRKRDKNSSSQQALTQQKRIAEAKEALYSHQALRKEHNSLKRGYPQQINKQGESGSQGSGASYELTGTEKMSSEIMRYYTANRQTKDTFRRKLELRKTMYSIVKEIIPNCGLYITGSSVTGFGLNQSDMDMTLLMQGTELNRKEAFALLRKIQFSAVRRCSFLCDVMTINATCPILKFKDRIGGIECDLSAGNQVSVLNSYMLNAYNRLDSRVAPFMLYVKRWAKFHNINDASSGTISSYSLTLMAIHFLQAVQPPVLPCLHHLYPNNFHPGVDVRNISLNSNQWQYTSNNLSDVGSLFAGFIHYFATFDFDYQVMSVRMGGCIPRYTFLASCPLEQRFFKYICIEEPFNRTNTARAVYDEANFMKILYVFRSSSAYLKRSQSVEQLFRQPF